MKRTTKITIAIAASIAVTLVFALVAQQFLGDAGYKKIDFNEIKNLSDEEIPIEVSSILDIRYEYEEYGAAAMDDMSENERIAKTLAEFDLEYTDGGMAQYFTNPSRDTAPYLLESLRAIHAPQMAKALETYIAEQKIDMEDPLIFHYDSQKLLEWELERYKVNAIDEKLYKLIQEENFHEKMVAFIRYNLDELVFGEDYVD